jgi:hypothetical protein
MLAWDHGEYESLNWLLRSPLFRRQTRRQRPRRPRGRGALRNRPAGEEVGTHSTASYCTASTVYQPPSGETCRPPSAGLDPDQRQSEDGLSLNQRARLGRNDIECLRAVNSCLTSQPVEARRAWQSPFCRGDVTPPNSKGTAAKGTAALSRSTADTSAGYGGVICASSLPPSSYEVIFATVVSGD